MLLLLKKDCPASISFSAEKRYSDFANAYPEFLQRFPQHMIASYLGITKETLSRIRHQVSEKIKIAALHFFIPLRVSVIICQQIFLSFIIVLHLLPDAPSDSKNLIFSIS